MAPRPPAAPAFGVSAGIFATIPWRLGPGLTSKDTRSHLERHGKGHRVLPPPQHAVVCKQDVADVQHVLQQEVKAASDGGQAERGSGAACYDGRLGCGAPTTFSRRKSKLQVMVGKQDVAQ